MDWITDVSEVSRRLLGDLGNFSPTVDPAKREVKGWLDGEKEYFNADDLRALAAACIEAADWLDKRAAAPKEGGV